MISDDNRRRVVHVTHAIEIQDAEKESMDEPLKTEGAFNHTNTLRTTVFD